MYITLRVPIAKLKSAFDQTKLENFYTYCMEKLKFNTHIRIAERILRHEELSQILNIHKLKIGGQRAFRKSLSCPW